MTAPELWFQEPVFHDDDLAADGDDYRDRNPGGWRPDPKDLA